MNRCQYGSSIICSTLLHTPLYALPACSCKRERRTNFCTCHTQFHYLLLKVLSYIARASALYCNDDLRRMTAIIKMDSRFSTIYLSHPAARIKQAQAQALILETLLRLCDGRNTKWPRYDNPCSQATCNQQAKQGNNHQERNRA